MISTSLRVVPPLRAVSAGVDSLYLSLRGEMREGALSTLLGLRAVAANQHEPLALDLDEQDGSFLLRPHGWRGYPVWLSSPRYEAMLGASHPFPSAYVQLHSWYLHTLGVEDATAAAVSTLRDNLFVPPVAVIPSRIDVYADVQGWEPTAEDFASFVCRASTRRIFAETSELHQFGRRVAGFSFGRGDVVARIYDKTLELQRKDETWPHALWRDVDPSLPVWRVEFQYRRGALVSFGLRSLDAVLRARQELWEYGTRWLSLRRPTHDVVRGHWPEAPEWEALRDVTIGSPASTLVREHLAAADLRRLLRGMSGYLTSLGAAWDIEDDELLMRLAVPAVRNYLHERRSSFAQLVQLKRRRRRGR